MKSPQIFLIAVLIVLLASCKNDNTPSEPQDPLNTEKIVETENQITRADTTELEENVHSDTIKAETTKSIDTVSIAQAIPVQKEVPKKVERIKKVSKTVSPKNKAKAKITFEKTVHDFGDIEQGDVIEFSFKFINSGNAPLVINNASATCGCTQPNYPFLPIAPNETGSIGVRFDSKGKFGSQKPIITLNTNADPSEAKLYLEGMVNKKLEKAPAEKDSI